jgi:aspartyl/glutamyl-tRNA(Asn/Gln) amidotransferase C subunit
MKKDELLITAELAQIELQEGELEKLGAEVDQMLEYFEKMNAISVDDFEPTTHALSQGNQVREDISVDSPLVFPMNAWREPKTWKTDSLSSPTSFKSQ